MNNLTRKLAHRLLRVRARRDGTKISASPLPLFIQIHDRKRHQYEIPSICQEAKKYYILSNYMGEVNTSACLSLRRAGMGEVQLMGLRRS